jgi:hypothetical protein
MTARSIDGSTVIIKSIGNDGKIHGSVPGFYTSTWWHPSGIHNMYPGLSLEKETVLEFYDLQNSARTCGCR